MTNKHTLTHLDLFSGIGGFSLGLHKVGIKTIAFCEIDPWCQECLTANYPNITIYKDVRNLTVNVLKTDGLPNPDIITAGFPCQPFSLAGKRQGEKHESGNLFLEIVRLAKELLPKYMLLENVPGLLSMNKGLLIKRMFLNLQNAGYVIKLLKLNAADFGIPQNRLRIFLMCCRKDIYSILKYDYFPEIKPPPLSSVLEDKVDDKYYLKRNDFVFYKTPKKGQRLTVVGEMTSLKFQGTKRVLSIDGIAQTFLSVSKKKCGGGSGGGRTGAYLTRKGVRTLTILEVKRASGYPDNYIITEGKQGFIQLGNSVVPIIIEHLGLKFIQHNLGSGVI